MKKAKAPEKENSERWLVTYSDLMNLLLILFIILYSISQVDKAKAEQVAQSVRAGFGYVENGGTGEASGTGTGLDGVSMDGSPSFAASDAPAGSSASGKQGYWTQQAEAFQNFYNEVVTLLQQNNLDQAVDVTLDDRGVVISFKDNVLFPSGQAELSKDALTLIDSIGSLLNGLDFSWILVEGHTDTDPIHNAQFKDNMDLSNARAANVWRELVKAGLPAEKMASIGYGEFKPLAPNDSPENKAKNRRVVVNIMHNQIASMSEMLQDGTVVSPDAAASPSTEAAAAPSAATPSGPAVESASGESQEG